MTILITGATGNVGRHIVRHLAAAAISSALPIRPEGIPAATSSLLSLASLFIDDAKAPGAMALTMMPSGARRTAIRQVRWISPALLAVM